MARSRNIKPGFFTNDLLAEVDPLSRLLFAGLWCHADREGRLEDRPKKLKAEILPYDVCDIESLLEQLSRTGFICRYQAGPNSYIEVVNFKKHQNPHLKESASTIPAPGEHYISMVQSTTLTGTSPADSLNLIPDSLYPTADPSPLIPYCSADAENVDVQKKKVPGTGEAWAAYSTAYFYRYGVEPVRNAKINALVVSFVKRLGEKEAPHVAAFFVTHNNAYYVKQMHSLDAMVKDAEKLRTEWATQTQMTHTKAIQADKTQTNHDAFAPLLLEAQNRERNNAH